MFYLNFSVLIKSISLLGFIALLMLSSTKSHAQQDSLRISTQYLKYILEAEYRNLEAKDATPQASDEKNKDKTDSTKQKLSFKLSPLPYIFDDVMLVGGLSSSGLTYSKNHRNLRPTQDFHVGLGGYFPAFSKANVNIELHYAQRGFSHQLSETAVFRKHYLQMPIFVAFELPVFRNIDWRFLVGTQVSTLLHSNQLSDYAPSDLSNEDNFIYNTDQFSRLHYGIVFGVSFEYRDFYFRLRNYIGNRKLIETERGMPYALNIEFGHFLFRRFRYTQ
ncbi:MAG: outer membrane beta-barrel protein [Bernardetiaceae bacterium]|nr:outer membrane beta-barrel protein [Bernardetiaceae bacterium]